MKLTKKNAASVMGNINRFFKKDTKMFVGKEASYFSFHLGVKSEKKSDAENSFYFVNTEEYAYIAGYAEKYHSDGSLLVKDKYSYLTVCLGVGSDVTVKGSVMIIKPTKIGDVSLPVMYFYHMSVTEAEKRIRVKGAIRCLVDYLDREVCHNNDDFYTALSIVSKLNNLVEDIDVNKSEIRIDVDFHNRHIIQETKSSQVENGKSVKKSRNNDTVTLYVNIDKIYQNGINYNDKECYHLIYHGKTYNDIFSVMLYSDCNL